MSTKLSTTNTSRGTRSSGPVISILVASRNRPDALIHCIKSVLAQSFTEFELVILDDASDSPLFPAVSPNVDDPRIRWLQSDSPSGVAGARNRLVEEASTNYLVFLDDDAVLSGRNVLGEIVTEFEGDPRLGILAFRIALNTPDSSILQVPFSQRARKHHPDLTETRRAASYFVGAAHAIRKEVFENCGGYTPDLMYGHEELELSYAAIDDGYHILFSPELRAVHSPLTSLISNRGGELFFEVRNRMWIAYRRLPLKYAVAYVLIWLSIYGLKSVRVRKPAVFLRGLVAGLEAITRIHREPVSKEAVGYLEENYGRLWY